MRLAILVTPLLAACVSTPAPIDNQQAVAPIVAAERAFATRHQQVSVKQAFLEYSATDGVAVRPAGVVNVKQDLANWPDRDNAGQIVWWPMVAGIARSGDLGFTTGPAIYGGKSYGGYFTIWKKQADGGWKWLIDQGTGQTNIAPPSKPGDPVIVMPLSSLPPIDPTTAWDELRSADAALGEAMAQDSTVLLRRLAPDAYLLGFSQHAITGPSAVAAALRSRPPRMAMKHEGGGVSEAGDFGWTYGFANWTENGAEKRGSYLRAWQRRPGGWAIVADTVNMFGKN